MLWCVFEDSTILTCITTYISGVLPYIEWCWIYYITLDILHYIVVTLHFKMFVASQSKLSAYYLANITKPTRSRRDHSNVSFKGWKSSRWLQRTNSCRNHFVSCKYERVSQVNLIHVSSQVWCLGVTLLYKYYTAISICPGWTWTQRVTWHLFYNG